MMLKNMPKIFLFSAFILLSACASSTKENTDMRYFRLVKATSTGIAYEYSGIAIEKLKLKADQHCREEKKARLEGIYRIVNGHKLAKFICEY